MNAVATLAGAADRPVEEVGAKARTLGRLVASGVAVPEGLVLTRAVLDEVLGANGLVAEAATAAEVMAAAWPEAVTAAVIGVADHFGDGALAVRSSAAVEDGTVASYAGQYESVLGVHGSAELQAAVRRCWASAFTGQVRRYSGGAPGRTGMAVLVQRLVEADVAGVAFTADPVTGSREEVVVSAVTGLGVPVVSGSEEGDQWRVRDGVATPASVTRLALTRQQAEGVAALALDVEQLLGGPQDLEWAMADHRLVVLQARPITALPTPPAVQVPPGTWLKEVDRYPEPFHAFGARVAARLVSTGLTTMNREYGGLVDRFEMIMIGGESYLRVVPLGGHEGPPPPWWVLAVLARLAPPLRRRMRSARRRLVSLTTVMDDFDRVQLPRLAAEHRRLASVDQAGLSDAELDEHLGEVVGFLEEALLLHFRLVPAEVVPVFDLVQWCRRHLGWDTGKVLQLVAGSSATTTEPSARLAEIARQIHDDPVARAAVDEAEADLVERLRAARPELAGRVEEWCQRYAVRSLSDDPATPTLAERPALVARLLREQVAAGAGPSAGGSSASAASSAPASSEARALAAPGTRDATELDRLLGLARRGYALRETSAFWTASMPGGLVRRTMVEAGSRLHARRLLTQPGDVAHVELDTVRAALRDDPAAVQAVTGEAARNRAERAWVLQHPGPDHLGDPPSGVPDLRGLPGPGRRLNQALMWSQERHEPVPPRDASVLVGVAGCSGRHTGPVRVVRTPRDFDRVRHGDVLVCPTTDPAWSVLFGIAGALVTDHGGLLSHAAIVAREHGLPAVLATGAATQRLHDDQVVTVDGTTGVVLT